MNGLQSDETFDCIDGQRGIQMGAVAGLLAGMIAYIPAYGGQRIFFEKCDQGFPVMTLGDQMGHRRDRIAQRACSAAGCGPS